MSTEANIRHAQWQRKALNDLEYHGLGGEMMCPHQCEECGEECGTESHMVDAAGCQSCYDRVVSDILDGDV